MDWSLNRDDSNPDVMWAFEFYRDQESFDRHYSNSNPTNPTSACSICLPTKKGWTRRCA